MPTMLDDGSSMLMHQLSLNASAAVLACVLTATPTSSPLADPTVVLWKDHGAERIELAALADESIEELLLAVLGGPIEAASFRQIADHTQGDPLYLRELVTGALDSGALTDESGVWRLRGPLQPTNRLVELVNLRLGHLSEAERHVLELTAIGEPLAQPSLDELTEREAVESLEDKGFLTSQMDGRRLQVRLAHPVLTDVLRAGITPRRERALARALAETSGGRRQEDTLLMASLRLVGGGGNAELLLAGAKAARVRRDFALTERLARAAIEQGEGFDARLMAAEAAHVQGRHTEAERELTALALDAATTSERIRVALLRFDLAYYLRGVADVSAIDLLLKTAVDPAWRAELLARRLCSNGAALGPRSVVEAVPMPLTAGGSTLRSSLQSVVGGCLIRTGRLDDALGLLAPAPDTGVSVAEGVGEQAAEPAATEPWDPFGIRALSLVGLGRFAEAEALIGRVHNDLAVAAASPEGAIVATSLAALRLEQGRVRDAFLQAASAAGTFLDLGLPVAARAATRSQPPPWRWRASRPRRTRPWVSWTRSACRPT